MRNYKRIIGLITMFILAFLIGSFFACEPQKHTITFESNGGSVCKPIVTSGRHGLSLPTPQKDGYSFEGWYFDNGKWKKPLKSDSFSKKRLKEDVTVYAKWTFTGYRIRFESNDGSSVEDLVLQKDQKINAPPFTQREGYRFLGWCIDEACTTFYEFGVPVNKSMTLYAKWLSLDNLQHFYITFETNGGTEVDRIRVLEGESFTLPTTVRAGYDFMGWYIDAELKNLYPHGSVVTSNFTLYAKWQENSDLLTITFNTNGGNYIEPIRVLINQTFEKPIPEREGYRFINWYTDEELTQIYNFEKPAYASLTLYAKWEEIEEHKTYFTVSYYDGEELVHTETLEECTEVPNIEREKEGYIFHGWYEDQELTMPFDFENFRINENIHLYGKWTEHSSTSIIVDGMSFDLVEDHYVLSGFDNSKNTVDIPLQIDGILVKKIAQEAFKGSVITEIIIPDGIDEIGSSAFSYCRSLNKAEFEDTPQMGNYIFYGCDALTEVVFNDDISSIPDYMFGNCGNLKEIMLPLSCQEIGVGAFSNCRMLNNIQINLNNKKIKAQAFKDCVSLSEIELGNTEEIGSNAFYNSGLISINLSNVRSLGSSAFGNCSRLKEVHIGEKLEIIQGEYGIVAVFLESKEIIKFTVHENNLFYSAIDNNLYDKEQKTLIIYAPCQEGAEFSIPQGVERLEEFAFLFAKNLKTINICDTVEYIAETVFREMQSLEEITVDSGSLHFSSQDGVLYDKEKTCLIKYPKNKQGEDFSIPQTVEKIMPFSFMNTMNLMEVVFNGEKVTEIGEEAFSGSALSVISLPPTLAYIGARAFYNTKLARIVIPSDVAAVGEEAFANNPDLSEVKIGTGLKSLDRQIFANCQNLKEIIFFGSPEKIGDAFKDCPIESVRIEGDSVVQDISQNAFSSETKLYVRQALVDDYIALYGELFLEIIGF